jgi:hypothetical protein
VSFWCNKLKNSHIGIEDEHWSGRPSTNKMEKTFCASNKLSWQIGE